VRPQPAIFAFLQVSWLTRGAMLAKTVHTHEKDACWHPLLPDDSAGDA
jgi:hypothetical protein